MQTQASAHAVARQLQLLSEAQFLDSDTSQLEVTFVTYNAKQRVFGQVNLRVEQLEAGRFLQDILVTAVNAAWPSSTRQGVTALALPSAACLLALVSAVWCLWHPLHARALNKG